MKCVKNKIYINLNKAFTLTELLVSVAIIGILASIATSFFIGSRDKSRDSAIKNTLNTAMLEAELYRENNFSFEGVCLVADPNRAIGSIVLSAARRLSSSVLVGVDSNYFIYSATGGSSGSGRSAVCHDSATGWAAVVSLKRPKTSSSGWCVDSQRNSREVTTLPANTVVCPVC